MHILLINGPPRSGKDTVGAMIADMFGAVCVDKFARILKERTHALYGLFYTEDMVPPGPGEIHHEWFELVKDVPSDLFLGLTPRQAYINVSEMYFKPIHDQAIFGRLLADEWESEYEFGGMPNGNFILTDSGFAEEAGELLRRFPEADATLMRVHRDGCTFLNDSRSYLNIFDPNAVLEPRKLTTIDIWNDGTKAGLRQALVDVLSPILGEPSLRFRFRYVAEVQVPGADVCGGNPQWLEFGKPTNDLDHALAQIEAARRSHYQLRVVRLVDHFAADEIDLGERYIYPGDAPVYNLAGASA